MKRLLFALSIMFWLPSMAQNYLVTHNFIRSKVTEGYFNQKPGTTIPADDYCISKSEAMNWLYLNESSLPVDSRMPWWSELVPATFYEWCSLYDYSACAVIHGAFSSCGTWLYRDGYFDPYMATYLRDKIAVGNQFWIGQGSHTNSYCSTMPSGQKGYALNNQYLPDIPRTKYVQHATDTASDSWKGTPAQRTALAGINPLHKSTGLMSGKDASGIFNLSFSGPLNRCGVWPCEGSQPGEWVYSAGTFYAKSSKTYYIGAAANSQFNVRIDDNVLFSHDNTSTEAYRIWHMFPVYLTAGPHSIKMEAIGDISGTVPSVMGCEVYDNTVAEIEAAQSYDDLNILFTTKDRTSVCGSEAPGYDVSLYIAGGYDVCVYDVTGLEGYAISFSPACSSDAGKFTSYQGAISITINNNSFSTRTLYFLVDGFVFYSLDIYYGFSSYMIPTSSVPLGNVSIEIY